MAEEQQGNERVCRCYAVAASESEFCDDPCCWTPPPPPPPPRPCWCTPPPPPCWCTPPPPPPPPPQPLPPPPPPSSHPPHKPSCHPPHRHRGTKWARYIIPSSIVLTAVIVSISLTVTVMTIRTPEFPIPSAEFERFEINPSNPSFNFRLNAKVRVKNRNFGSYEFDATIVFCYRGVQVGEVAVFMSKANRRSAKNLKVTVDLVTPAVVDKESLATDLSIGVLPLTIVVEIEGQVRILFFKKKKSAKICCDMEINTRAVMVQNINCK